MDPVTMAAIAQALGMVNSAGYGLGAGDSSAAFNLLMPGLGSFMAGRKAKKEKKRAQNRFKKALGVTEAIQGRNLSQQEALSKQATAQELGGYDTARREAARLGRTGKQEALDRATQLQASAAQNLTNRGLGSTTAGANLSRGIGSDLTRANMGIDEGLASLFGNLAIGRGGVESAGTQRLAQLGGQRADLDTQLAQMKLLGGATLGNLGSFDPGSFMNPGAGALDATNQGMGGLLGSFGGGQGNAQLMQMLQKLFSQGGGGLGGATYGGDFSGF